MNVTIAIPAQPQAGPATHERQRTAPPSAPAAFAYIATYTPDVEVARRSPEGEGSESDIAVAASRAGPYKQTYTTSYANSGYTMATPTTVKALKAPISPIPSDAWKAHTNPFLAMPPEIHIEIFSRLNPIDAVCLSLVNPYLHHIYLNILPQPTINNLPLTTGSPSSTLPLPLPKNRSCKHCVPVLYYPAHCELHYHIRNFIPRHLQFCSGPCKRYTRHESKGYSDSAEHCGKCGVNYSRRYQRGRRMIDVKRPGEKQERLNKWYNGVENIPPPRRRRWVP